MIGETLWALRWLPTGLPRREKLAGWFWCHDDVTGSKVWHRTPFEPFQRRFVSEWLEPGMTVLDIGANQGLYTLMASQRCGPRGRVVAFEPCRTERIKLRWNLMWNLCRNVSVRCDAVGREPADKLVFYAVVGAETGGNSLRPPAADLATATRQEQVAMTSVDAFCEQAGLSHVDFIKVDVEGGELDVLRGGSRLLSSPSRPLLLLEVADVRTAPWGYAARDIVTFLTERGYSLFEIADGRLVRHAIQTEYRKDLLAVPSDAMAPFTAKMTAKGWGLGT